MVMPTHKGDKSAYKDIIAEMDITRDIAITTELDIPAQTDIHILSETDVGHHTGKSFITDPGKDYMKLPPRSQAIPLVTDEKNAPAFPVDVIRIMNTIHQCQYKLKRNLQKTRASGFSGFRQNGNGKKHTGKHAGSHQGPAGRKRFRYCLSQNPKPRYTG